MFEIITKSNLINSQDIDSNFSEQITLRGYETENTGLPGEFQSLIVEKRITPLSVGAIADKHCPTRRDLYFTKGVNRVKAKDQTNWGRKAGKVVEDYYNSILANGILQQRGNYTTISNEVLNFNSNYFDVNTKKFKELEELELTTTDMREGDTAWLITLLKNSGRIDLALSLLHKMLVNDETQCTLFGKKDQPEFLDLEDIQIAPKLEPNYLEIGINNPSEPDLLIPKRGMVGDIKTGISFNLKYQLTCTGYALAYENQYRTRVDWGVIYFIPTRTPYRYARILNFPQVHIFPITEELRQWFLDNRDEAYSIISKSEAPNLPLIDNRKECKYCKFLNHCKEQGLTIEE